jgi:ABC-type antimicrobial peptide transport system permease subunit
LLTESLLLSVAGAGAGLGIATFGTKALIAIAPIDTPGIEAARLEPLVIAYTVAMAFLNALIFGLLPAVRSSQLELSGRS